MTVENDKQVYKRVVQLLGNSVKSSKFDDTALVMTMNDGREFFIVRNEDGDFDELNSNFLIEVFPCNIDSNNWAAGSIVDFVWNH